ncbi:MAG TPA: hypothetical protein VH137_02250, partial [Gemmatimonadales bacterium]|nr:hypothetical protein [Gemmatimonadales bacterium]
MSLALALVTLGVLQGTQPLRKAELVRLLATGAMTKPAIATLVRRNCVTFRPTARDRAELRTAGADDAVLTAIDQCLRARAVARAPRPQPRTPPAPPLHVVVTRQLTAPVGSEIEVGAQLFRGAVPERGVLLTLRGASAVRGGVTQDPTAITDERGVATFRVLSGTTPAAYRLTVAAPNGPPFGDTGDIAFVTTPVQPAAAPPPPPPKPIASEPRTQFTHGAGLHGTVGGALGSSLVLEVHDEKDVPISRQAVSFTVTGGASVQPGATETDVAGIAQAHVTLGERAGPVVVTARVGDFTRTATLYADPGPPRALVLLRGDAPVTGLDLRSRDTVVVRAVVRDAYGNGMPVENFKVTTTGGLGGAMAVRTTDSVGVLTLVPRRSGAGTLELAGSGLRARAAVSVALRGSSASPWAIGARSAWLSANTPWLGPTLTANSGVDFAIFGRRTLIAGLSLSLGGAAGSINSDRTTPGGGSVSVLLAEGYGGAEWSVAPGAVVSPVLAIAAGAYRLKSGDDGQTLYHTSEFWS